MNTAFDVPGNWYKGITHIHSTVSDGKWTVPQLAEWYKTRGYDFWILTDHLICTDTRSLSTSTFLTIPGIEIHGPDTTIGRTPHLVGLGAGIEGHVEQGTGMQQMIDQINGKDMLAVVAHPYWSALLDQHLAAATGYVAIEIYNHTCWEHVGKGDSLTYWDNLLYAGRRVWGIAVDDAHCSLNPPDVGGGWIVVKAPALTETAVLEAIRDGHFYASQGPAIYDWTVRDTTVQVRCSPVERIQLNAPNGSGRMARASQGEAISEATFTLSELPPYLRVTCVDHQRLRAWTNPVFPDRPVAQS